MFVPFLSELLLLGQNLLQLFFNLKRSILHSQVQTKDISFQSSSLGPETYFTPSTPTETEMQAVTSYILIVHTCCIVVAVKNHRIQGDYYYSGHYLKTCNFLKKNIDCRRNVYDNTHDSIPSGNVENCSLKHFVLQQCIKLNMHRVCFGPCNDLKLPIVSEQVVLAVLRHLF